MGHIKAATGNVQAPIEMSDFIGFQNVKGKATLLCPKCREANLHHGAVTVNQRHAGEDSPGTSTLVEQGFVHVIPGKEAFTGRRDCLAIAFSCEHCGDAEFILRITQHKGSTFMYWEVPPSK